MARQPRTTDAGAGREARPRRPARVLAWLVAAAVVVALLIGAGAIRGWSGWLPELRNPFTEETTDRSGPALLESVQDLSRFTAASGTFEVIIDVESGRRFIPDFLVNRRTLFVAVGSVDAYVEFGGLDQGALAVDEANRTVAVTLPAPELTTPNLDPQQSYVYTEERGVVDRIHDFFVTDPDGLREVLVLAEQRIAEAAAESELRDRAEVNTKLMLSGLFRSLGYGLDGVTFVAP